MKPFTGQNGVRQRSNYHFKKEEILFPFLSVGENRCYCRSFVKTKWYKVNFWIAGETYIYFNFFFSWDSIYSLRTYLTAFFFKEYIHRFVNTQIYTLLQHQSQFLRKNQVWQLKINYQSPNWTVLYHIQKLYLDLYRTDYSRPYPFCEKTGITLGIFSHLGIIFNFLLKCRPQAMLKIPSFWW